MWMNFGFLEALPDVLRPLRIAFRSDRDRQPGIANAIRMTWFRHRIASVICGIPCEPAKTVRYAAVFAV